MKVVVTGGCGFMGSHLVEALLAAGHEVVIIDNLSSGSLDNLPPEARGEVDVVVEDLKLWGHWPDALKGADAVFHFAANPEVRVSTVEPRIHFEENVVATFNVLEACRRRGVKYLVFASSSTVYGDARRIPTPEDHPIEPISVYGASKAASETLIATYSRLYGIRPLILRYANVIGPRTGHGVVVDFTRKLRANPRALEILGDGTQRKSYMYIEDAVDATMHLFRLLAEGGLGHSVFNVGSRDWITVREIADIVVEEMGLRDVAYRFVPATPDGRGWPGDVKLMLLDISRLESTGWKPRYTSSEAVRLTARWVIRKL